MKVFLFHRQREQIAVSTEQNLVSGVKMAGMVQEEIFASCV